jgi:hypothetical protein
MCAANLATTVDPGAPPLFTITAAEQNVTLCNVFNGNINTVQILINGVPSNNADFDFVWFRNNLNTVVLDGADPLVSVDDALTVATYMGIDTATYYVYAIRAAGGDGINCQSSPIQFEIEDDRIYPQVSVQSVPSSACDDNHDGQITVTASTSTGPGMGSGYNFQWTADPDGGGPISIANGSNVASPFVTAPADVVGEALYSIRVTNVATSCFTDANHAVSTQSIPLSITSVTSTAVEVCSSPGDGSATVGGMAAGMIGDYTYSWADNPQMSNPSVTNDLVG